VHVDHAQRGIAGFVIARRGLGRVILQWAKNGAERYLHLRARFHVLKHDHAALFENVVDLGAHGFVVDVVPVHAVYARAEGQIIPEIAYGYICHFILSHEFLAILWAMISAICRDSRCGGRGNSTDALTGAAML
jgi:hypothetical protein